MKPQATRTDFQIHAEMSKMYATVVFLALSIFLSYCSAQDLKCTAIQNGTQTIYVITVSNSTTSYGCAYDWTDPSGRLIAHEGKKDTELVVSGSINSLTVYGCYASLKYQRDCISEGSPRITYCAINCTTAPSAVEAPSTTRPPGKEGLDLTAFIIVLIATVLVIGGIVACCIRKDQIHSFCTKVDEWVRGNKQRATEATGNQAEPPANGYVEVPME